MKILLTGFDPFDREKVNPAFEAVKLLPDTIAGAQIVKLEVPTQFVRASEALEAAMAEHKPDVVICVGQAGGRAAITPEKVAINLMDGRIPDNAGYQPVDVPIRADGPAAYFATLPVKAMVQRMQDAGIPAAVSYTAGTYVCNHLYYTLLSQNRRGCFIHVPYSAEQAEGTDRPCLEIAQMTRGILAAIEAAL